MIIGLQSPALTPSLVTTDNFATTSPVYSLALIASVMLGNKIYRAQL
jgi:hypothetical protein